MIIDRFTVIHVIKKSIMVLILLVALACSMMGCGIQKHNEYVNALNTLGNSITTAETKEMAAADKFKQDPSDADTRKEYGQALAAISTLYGSYADMAYLDEVAAEHQELVDAANGIAQLYNDMAVIMLDASVDFTTNTGIQSLLDITENLDDLAEIFLEKMDILVGTINS